MRVFRGPLSRISDKDVALSMREKPNCALRYICVLYLDQLLPLSVEIYLIGENVQDFQATHTPEHFLKSKQKNFLRTHLNFTHKKRKEIFQGIRQ